MKVLVTGASGHIGGSVAAALLDAGHRAGGLVRAEERAAAVRDHGIEPRIGTLDDAGLLAAAAREADAVINAANAEHRGAVEAILPALAGSHKPFLQTSGSSIVADLAGGEPTRQDLRRGHAGAPPAGPQGAGCPERYRARRGQRWRTRRGDLPEP